MARPNFHKLPAELRLAVYREIWLSVLEDGDETYTVLSYLRLIKHPILRVGGPISEEAQHNLRAFIQQISIFVDANRCITEGSHERCFCVKCGPEAAGEVINQYGLPPSIELSVDVSLYEIASHQPVYRHQLWIPLLELRQLSDTVPRSSRPAITIRLTIGRHFTWDLPDDTYQLCLCEREQVGELNAHLPQAAREICTIFDCPGRPYRSLTFRYADRELDRNGYSVEDKAVLLSGVDAANEALAECWGVSQCSD